MSLLAVALAVFLVGLAVVHVCDRRAVARIERALRVCAEDRR